METGIDEIGVPPFSRKPEKKGAVKPSSANLKKALRYLLEKEGGISDKEEWIKKFIKQPIYKINVPICRFLLLVASHDTCPDVCNKGLVVRAKPGYLSLINQEQWWRKDRITIEHIAPQIDDKKLWDADIYEKELEHSIGNLTLLPSLPNSCASNMSWKHKRLIYKVLSSSTDVEHNLAIDEAKKEEIILTTKAADVLADSKYLPHVVALGKIDDEWSVDYIEKRSKRIAEIIWETLYKWLE
jgi:hypothetical protein